MLPWCPQTGSLTAEQKKMFRPGVPTAGVTSCCVTKYHQQSRLKQGSSIISASVGQGSRHSLARFSAPGSHQATIKVSPGPRCHLKSPPGRSPRPGSLRWLANPIPVVIGPHSLTHGLSRHMATCFSEANGRARQTFM